jgi:hypothetical protein
MMTLISVLFVFVGYSNSRICGLTLQGIGAKYRAEHHI